MSLPRCSPRPPFDNNLYLFFFAERKSGEERAWVCVCVASIPSLPQAPLTVWRRLEQAPGLNHAVVVAPFAHTLTTASCLRAGEKMA